MAISSGERAPLVRAPAGDDVENGAEKRTDAASSKGGLSALAAAGAVAGLLLAGDDNYSISQTQKKQFNPFYA